ncbi:MAG: hypothetical protein DRJ52_00340 [Thermoprotei archaeon]|nr:MAG: hypothetical protein DRJ52_00340 [Thermoprotei archaeon]RLF00300.1 MAG: hypothetical protein DRJ63_02895 [Thermoprotei archaeon]
MEGVKIEVVEMSIPAGCNIILGMAHFIKTVEDLYEALVNSVPQIRFGIAFCESSGPCLIRSEGNDEELKKIAIENARKLSAGHVFVILMKNAWPINVLNAIKMVPEVTRIFCATANPVQVIVCETNQGKGVLGVVDGYKTKGIETTEDVQKRRKFLREIGYKLS